VTSREGKKGMASMDMFFSDFRAFVNATAAEVDDRLKRVEKVNNVNFCLCLFLQFGIVL
jgi:hypothetical protein